MDQANNIALLELFLALFLGLLFRVNVVSDDAAEGALFEVVAALLGLFIFVYPVVRIFTLLNPGWWRADGVKMWCTFDAYVC